MKHIDIERVRKESANVLVIENANPGAPHLQSVYVDDLCDAIDSLRARAEKAEAERDQLKQLHRHALDCVDQVFQPGSKIPNPILPDFCEVGEDKFQAAIRLAKSYLAERARAEKAEAELRVVDEVLSGRPATAGLSREDAILKACRAAGKADEAEARAEKYLAAMERALGLFEQGRTIMAVGVIRTIVEEARRG